jgi:hypothetical protein
MKRILPLLFLALPLLAKEPTELQLTWTDLNKSIRGHEVAIPFADGTQARGKVAMVTADAIVLQGRHEVPRPSVGRVQLIEIRGHKRWWIAVLGYFGVAAVISAGSSYGGEALQGPGTLAALTGGAIGYAVGRHLDRRITWIQIVPAPTPIVH